MFRYSICDPLKKEPIDLGEIEKDKILDILDKLPWADLLDKMKGAKESEIYYSPSIEFENKTNRHGLSISIVENDYGHEFYIFYKRPKMVSKFFGLSKSIDENYVSERLGQSNADVKDAVTALLSDDIITLENRWG